MQRKIDKSSQEVKNPNITGKTEDQELGKI